MLGSFGEGRFIQGSIAFHYGKHTKIGKSFFGHFHLTIQDDDINRREKHLCYAKPVHILSPVILSVTNLSEQATNYLRWMLVMCSYYLVGKSVNGTTIAGIFCAGGDSRFGFLCDVVTMWCIIVLLALIAAFIVKVPVLMVYFIVDLDEIVKLPAVYRHYKKYHWIKDLTNKEDL